MCRLIQETPTAVILVTIYWLASGSPQGAQGYKVGNLCGLAPGCIVTPT